MMFLKAAVAKGAGVCALHCSFISISLMAQLMDADGKSLSFILRLLGGSQGRMYVNMIKLMFFKSANRWQAKVLSLSCICQLKECLLVIQFVVCGHHAC